MRYHSPALGAITAVVVAALVITCARSADDRLEPPECRLNSDCPLGSICTDAGCVEECERDLDCPQGQRCELRGCVPDDDGGDGDSDTDTDRDADADADTDAAGESDVDVDTGVETDVDADSDNGADADIDGDADGDGDAHIDSGADGDVDVDADADSDTDSDTDTDSDADGDADSGGDAECVPNCGDRECNLDPVCGTLSCGSCSSPGICNTSGICECQPDCAARECGLDPVCGTLQCGTCTLPETCNGAGSCGCVPECSGRECGPDTLCGAACPPDSCGLSHVCNADGLCVADGGDAGVTLFRPHSLAGFVLELHEDVWPAGNGPEDILNTWDFTSASEAVLCGIGAFAYTYAPAATENTSSLVFEVGGSDRYYMTWTSEIEGTFEQSFDGFPGNSGVHRVVGACP